MILVEIRPKGRKTTTIAVHPNVTVLRGLDAAGRRAWAADLAKALQGDTSAAVDVEVDLAGTRQVLTPAVAAQLGLDPTCEVIVHPGDLPGARPASASEPEPEPESAAAPTGTGAALVRAETEVAELQRRLDAAERAAKAADLELNKAKAGVDDSAAARIPGLEAILDVARTATEDARRKLADLETRIARVNEEASAQRSEFRALIDRLQTERTTLEANRAELVGRMIETGDPGDPKAVEEALQGLRRLQSVKPKPSSRAAELAEQWVEASARLAALPQPPQPPEWLVTPALEALQEARDAVAAAESGSDELDVDPARIEALDRAHREVLESEQRTMKKSSRSNRKKLEAAHEAERTALSALGVTSYGEYLQHVAPNISGGGNREERLADAKAALADAEAVWEELHGGQASPEWTEAKQHQAAIRQEALEVLGADVDDADLDAALRGHLETVVDTEWAEQALVTALRRGGVHDIEVDADLEAVADRWLQESPSRRETRTTLQAELEAIDSRLAVVEEQLVEHQSNDFFGDDGGDEEPSEDEASLATMRTRVEDAETTEAEAESALQRARFEASAAETKRTVLSALENTATARHTDVQDLTTQLADAEAALATTKAAASKAEAEANAKPKPKPKAAAAASSNGAVDLSSVVGMEAEAYLLARVAALRGATGGPLPMVLDADLLSGLSERAAKRVFRLLGRLADSMQLVVLGDDEEIATWAEGLGDRAAVRTVAR